MPTARLQKFLRQNWALLGVMLLAGIVIAWLGVHALLQFIWFQDPRHQDVDLKGWMTPQYIVKTYDLPRDVVAETLNLGRGPNGPRKLKDIAEGLGLSMEELTALIRTTAEQYRGATHD
ncbi:MAG: hypothetical protein ABJO67_12605 [Pseudoruegeria sp.]